MTVAEIALAIMLVAGAGWLVRGFAESAQHRPRVRRRQAADLRRLVPRAEVSERRRGRTRVAQRLDRDAARAPRASPPSARRRTFRCSGALESSLIVQFHGEAVDPAHPMGTRQRFVSPGYFAAMGTKIAAGPRLRPRRSAEHAAGRDRQPDVREAVPRRPRSDRRAVLGRLSRRPIRATRSPSSASSTTCGRRRVSDEAEPAFYSPLTQIPAAAADDGRGDVGRRRRAAAVGDSRRGAQARSADRGRVRAA